MKKPLIFFFLSCAFFLFFVELLAIKQLYTSIDASQNQSIPISSLNHDTIVSAELPFTLTLVLAEQYMQSARFIFKLTNNEPEQLNNFWLHVSLLDTHKGFLYREQPVLFSEIGPHSSQSIELLCESVGIVEVGYVVLHPQLLEIDRVEQAFDTKCVELVQANNTDALMVFSSSLR